MFLGQKQGIQSEYCTKEVIEAERRFKVTETENFFISFPQLLLFQLLFNTSDLLYVNTHLHFTSQQYKKYLFSNEQTRHVF